MKHEELIDLLRRNGGTRQTVIRVLAEPVENDNVVFEKETVEVESPEGLQIVEWYGTRRCSCGHAIDEKTTVAGTCSVCRQTVCSADSGGCSTRCMKCGVLCCRADSRIFVEDGEERAYCPSHACRHRLARFLKAVFG